MNIKVNQQKERQQLDQEQKKEEKGRGRHTENEGKVRSPHTPFHMQWVADIIKPFLADNTVIFRITSLSI
jgi:hypothetical protein